MRNLADDEQGWFPIDLDDARAEIQTRNGDAVDRSRPRWRRLRWGLGRANRTTVAVEHLHQWRVDDLGCSLEVDAEREIGLRAGAIEGQAQPSRYPVALEWSSVRGARLGGLDGVASRPVERQDQRDLPTWVVGGVAHRDGQTSGSPGLGRVQKTERRVSQREVRGGKGRGGRHVCRGGRRGHVGSARERGECRRPGRLGRARCQERSRSSWLAREADVRLGLCGLRWVRRCPDRLRRGCVALGLRHLR